MTIATAQYNFFFFFLKVGVPISTIDMGTGSPYLCSLGTVCPILYSYAWDPIHIGRGPQIYEGVPISTIDMGMGVPISM